jgi:hypothetical protein
MLCQLVEHGIFISVAWNFYADLSKGHLREGLLRAGFLKVLVDRIGEQSYALDVLSVLAKHREINCNLSSHGSDGGFSR